MDIPVPYKVILKRFYDSSFKGKLEVKKARIILSHYSRIPKNMITPLFREMEDMGWILFENFKTIKVIKKVDCEIMYSHPNQKEYDGKFNL